VPCERWYVTFATPRAPHPVHGSRIARTASCTLYWSKRQTRGTDYLGRANCDLDSLEHDWLRRSSRRVVEPRNHFCTPLRGGLRSANIRRMTAHTRSDTAHIYTYMLKDRTREREREREREFASPASLLETNQYPLWLAKGSPSSCARQYLLPL